MVDTAALEVGALYYYSFADYGGRQRVALLLDTALWRQTYGLKHDLDRFTREENPDSQPGRRYSAPGKWSWRCGYLILAAPEGYPEVLGRAPLTVADVIDGDGYPISGALPEGCELLVVHHGYLNVEPDERAAKVAAQRRAQDGMWRTRNDAVDRHNRIAAALNAVLDEPIAVAGVGMTPTSVTLTLEQAEQVAARLAEGS